MDEKSRDLERFSALGRPTLPTRAVAKQRMMMLKCNLKLVFGVCGSAVLFENRVHHNGIGKFMRL